MKLIMASSNKNKIQEIVLMLKGYEILSLQDIGFNSDIEENGKTFKDNALIKAKTIYDIYHIPVIADDSGLCVEALGMEPGVYSHRYAGPMQDDSMNNALLVKNLQGVSNRNAFYECAICYYDGAPMFFEGRVYGSIVDDPKGNNGFGYDPHFFISSLGKTMAEITIEEKNKISHRSIAVKKLGDYLNELSNNIR